MLKKLKRYRFLFEELVKRDFKKKYKGAVLGLGWSLLSPLLMLLVMKLVFTQFFGRATPHYTIYLFAGNLIFSYFSEATKGGMTSLMENAKIFTKVDVPKYIFLFSKNVQTFIGFLLTLVLFFIFVAFDGLAFSWEFLMLLYPTVLLLAFNIGVGLILSALYVFFRDTKYLYDVFLKLLMYASAIFLQHRWIRPLGAVYFPDKPGVFVYTIFPENRDRWRDPLDMVPSFDGSGCGDRAGTGLLDV